LEYPPLDCNNVNYVDTNDPKAYLLDGDKPCLVFPLSASADLKYMLDCHFTQPIGPISQEVLNANFTYFINTTKFAIYMPTYWSMRFKIYNFNVLSDIGAQTELVLTKEQMEGTEPIWINTTLSKVPSQYWHGNRLYAELLWYQVSPATGISILDRRFLDSPDYKTPSSQTKNSNTITIVVSVVVGVIGIAVIVLLIVFRQRVKELFS